MITQKQALFLSRVQICSSGCWTWTGPIDKGGYGIARESSSQKVSASRLACILFNGPVPKHLHVDHLCRNRLCVNPSHLEAVTQKENWRRGREARGEYDYAEACKRGHPWGDNPKRTKRGWRRCLLCEAVLKEEKKLLSKGSPSASPDLGE